jgi:acylphosphatase
MSDTVRASLVITGRVQGVFFRANAMAEAQRLGLTGYVQNLPDGAVEAIVEGDGAQVEEFVGWCRVGPPAARVEDVRVRLGPALGEFRTFTVER